MTFLRKLWYRCIPRYERLELRHVPWQEADALIKRGAATGNPEDVWYVAPEEDSNRLLLAFAQFPLRVYIERRRRILQ